MLKYKKCQCFNIFTIYRFSYYDHLMWFWQVIEPSMKLMVNQKRNCKQWIWKANCCHIRRPVLLWPNSPSREIINSTMYLLFALWPNLPLLEFNVEWMEINSTPSEVCCFNCTVKGVSNSKQQEPAWLTCWTHCALSWLGNVSFHLKMTDYR